MGVWNGDCEAWGFRTVTVRLGRFGNLGYKEFRFAAVEWGWQRWLLGVGLTTVALRCIRKAIRCGPVGFAMQSLASLGGEVLGW